MPVARNGSSKRSGGARRHQKKGASAAAVARNVTSSGDDAVTSSCQVSRFHTDANEEYASSATNIELKLVCVNVSGKELLDDATVSLQPGHIYGLMGKNGAGKTTLLRQLAIQGKLVPPHISSLLVEQEDVGDCRTALQTVMQADERLGSLLADETLLQAAIDGGDVQQAATALATVRARHLRAEAQELHKLVDHTSGARGQQHRFRWNDSAKAAQEAEAAVAEAKLHDRTMADTAEALLETRNDMTDSGVDPGEAEARAATVLRGLGFKPEHLAQPTSTLSGGWRMRVALARALFMQPRLLMLDEPTNHLDLPAILWLEQWMAEMDPDMIVVIVSHDIAFLDAVCTDIVRLVNLGLEYYLNMNYSTHAEATQDRVVVAQRELGNRERRKQTMEKSIKAMIHKAQESGDDKRLKQAAARQRKMEERVGVDHNAKGMRFKLNRDKPGLHTEMGLAVDMPALDPAVRLELSSAEPLGYYGPVLQLNDVAVGWHPKQPPVIAGVTLNIDMGSRIGILGKNGSGKSTLIAGLVGDQPMLKGTINRHHNLRLGVFNQHHLDGVVSEGNKMTVTPSSIMMDKFSLQEQESRAHLAKFGLSGRLAVQPVGTLSGGQKARLALSLLFWNPPHILILDEPTNHLDVQTVLALGQAIEEFDGGLILISHDRHLLAKTCSEFFVTREHKLRPLEGGVEEYAASLRKNI